MVMLSSDNEGLVAITGETSSVDDGAISSITEETGSVVGRAFGFSTSSVLISRLLSTRESFSFSLSRLPLSSCGEDRLSFRLVFSGDGVTLSSFLSEAPAI